MFLVDKAFNHSVVFRIKNLYKHFQILRQLIQFVLVMWIVSLSFKSGGFETSKKDVAKDIKGWDLGKNFDPLEPDPHFSATPNTE